MRKVLELTAGTYPEFNVWPTRQLVMEAWSQGYDIVLKPLASTPTPPANDLAGNTAPASLGTPRGTS